MSCRTSRSNFVNFVNKNPFGDYLMKYYSGEQISEYDTYFLCRFGIKLFDILILKWVTCIDPYDLVTLGLDQ